MLNKYVIVYINSILIYSSSFDEDVCHVRAMLTRLHRNCLYVKLEKC